MGRRSSRELVQRIASSLTARPQSVQEIATAIDADHTSVRKYLEGLAAAGVIRRDESGSTEQYALSQRVTEDTNTYFGLRLTDEQERQVFSLFALIREQWKEKTGDEPSRTQAQKTAVRVLDNHPELDIPYGWYLYGSITAAVYDPDEPYEYQGLPDEGAITESVDDAIDAVSEPDNWNEVRLQQYREQDKELYLVKERIQSQLTDYAELGDNPGAFEDDLNEFLTHLPPITDSEVEQLLTEFVAISSRLVSTAKDDSELQTRCIRITEALNTIWDIVGLYEFYNDLQEYYDQDELTAHLMAEHDDKKEEAINAVSTLADMLPQPNEPDNPYYQQLKDLDETASEPSDSDKSDLFGKFGIK